MMGLSTSGSDSFGCALVAGSSRVPYPAASTTALRTCTGPPVLIFLSVSAAAGAGPSGIGLRYGCHASATPRPAVFLPGTIPGIEGFIEEEDIAVKRLLVSSLGLLALAAFAGWAALSASAATRNVTVADDSYTDAVSGNSTTTINAGDTVHWIWNGSLPHTVSSTSAEMLRERPIDHGLLTTTSSIPSGPSHTSAASTARP